MSETAALLQAILFREAAPMSIEELAKMIGGSVGEVEFAVNELSEALHSQGVCLVVAGQNIELRTSPTVAEKLAAFEKQDTERELGRAGLETLAAVLYRAPISRAEIDHLRGVNSAATLRTLLIRGLIEKSEAKGRTLYQPTTDALGYLGLSKNTDAPEYQTYREALTIPTEHAEN